MYHTNGFCKQDALIKINALDGKHLDKSLRTLSNDVAALQNNIIPSLRKQFHHCELFSISFVNSLY